MVNESICRRGGSRQLATATGSALADATDEQLLQQLSPSKMRPRSRPSCNAVPWSGASVSDSCIISKMPELLGHLSRLGRKALSAVASCWPTSFGVARRCLECTGAAHAPATNTLRPTARRAGRPILLERARSVLDDGGGTAGAQIPPAIDLCCLEGMTHTQASASLGWPVGTVAGRLSRGREVLRSRLARRGVLASGVVLPALLIADSATASLPPHLAAASLRSAVAFFMAGHSAPADISVAVATLVRGVLQKMLLHRLLMRSMLTALAALALGGAVGSSAHSYDPAPPRRDIRVPPPGTLSLPVRASPPFACPPIRMPSFCGFIASLITPLRRQLN